MNTSVSSQITLIRVEPCVVASTTCRGMITSASSWVVSRSLLSMVTPLKISTGVEASPVTSRLCFIVASWVSLSLQLLTDCIDDLLFAFCYPQNDTVVL